MYQDLPLVCFSMNRNEVNSLNNRSIEVYDLLTNNSPYKGFVIDNAKNQTFPTLPKCSVIFVIVIMMLVVKMERIGRRKKEGERETTGWLLQLQAFFSRPCTSWLLCHLFCFSSQFEKCKLRMKYLIE